MNRIKEYSITFSLFMVLIVVGCTSDSGKRENKSNKLNVFAAASLSEAFGEIGKDFEEANPGTQVVFNFAGSQQLAQQIIQGAPTDVFASANQKQMDAVIKAGESFNGNYQIFASNRLVVIYSLSHPPSSLELQVLSKENMHLVLAASEVPAGQYSLDFLDKASEDPAFGMGFKGAVLKNVVSYEENVRGVLSKISLGEADAGIVYASDVTGENAERVGIIEIPAKLNVIATYPITITKASKNQDLAQRFIDYLLSSGGQAVLGKYNFTPLNSFK